MVSHLRDACDDAVKVPHRHLRQPPAPPPHTQQASATNNNDSLTPVILVPLGRCIRTTVWMHICTTEAFELLCRGTPKSHPLSYPCLPGSSMATTSVSGRAHWL